MMPVLRRWSLVPENRQPFLLCVPSLKSRFIYGPAYELPACMFVQTCSNVILYCVHKYFDIVRTSDKLLLGMVFKYFFVV